MSQNKWYGEEPLEVVEMYAEEQGWICDEDELSAAFDRDVLPSLDRHDQCEVDQSFNDWSDGLCKSGVIHPLQYHHYTYVGEARER